LVPARQDLGGGRADVGHAGKVDAQRSDTLLEELLKGVGETLSPFPVQPHLHGYRGGPPLANLVDPHSWPVSRAPASPTAWCTAGRNGAGPPRGRPGGTGVPALESGMPAPAARTPDPWCPWPCTRVPTAEPNG